MSPSTYWTKTTQNLAILQADKHTLVLELGLPYRDLRILDPNVSSTPLRAYVDHLKPSLTLRGRSYEDSLVYSLILLMCWLWRAKFTARLGCTVWLWPVRARAFLNLFGLFDGKKFLQVATAYPTAILIREKALVIHLEAVRMIVCKDQMLIISAPIADSSAQSCFPTPDLPFIQDLVMRIGKLASQAE